MNGIHRARGVTAAAIAAAALATSIAASFWGCGSSKPSPVEGTGSGSSSGSGSSGNVFTAMPDGAVPDSGVPFDQNVNMTYDDFANPVLDQPDGGGGAMVPANAPALFGPAGSADDGSTGDGPCIVEPEDNALFPNNWVRPRFRWNPPGGANLFEVRIHAKNQTSDLVAYTGSTSWTMPADLWAALNTDSADVPLTLTVRSGTYAGGTLTNEAVSLTLSMMVAPAPAPGRIVYWTTADGTSLKQFQIGDETVGTVLVPSQVQGTPLTGSDCFGCHTGAPDGLYSVLSTSTNSWGDTVALIDPDAGTVGATPPFLGAGGAATLTQGDLGISAVSAAHWANGDHTVISSDGTNLVWLDLEATTPANARGTLARNGTQPGGNLAGAPAWSHDGTTIVYVATNHLQDGRLGNGTSPSDPGSRANLYTVPFAGRAGGTIAPLPGASDTSMQEYYPSFSPDDAFVAFDECSNDDGMYNQPHAEVYVVPRHGGTATKLVANTPAACSGATSPGVTNSWPKWSPAVTTVPDGRSFYWLVFSSTRFNASVPQLFVAGMVVGADGKVSTYGALYLWNQPSDEGNHTPAWEFFQLPSNPPGSGNVPK